MYTSLLSFRLFFLLSLLFFSVSPNVFFYFHIVSLSSLSLSFCVCGPFCPFCCLCFLLFCDLSHSLIFFFILASFSLFFLFHSYIVLHAMHSFLFVLSFSLGHEMLRSNSEGCDTSQPIVTRKRLSFSPTRKSKRQNTKLTEENREIQTKNDTSPHSKNSKDKSIEPSASNEQSAKKTTTKQCSYVVDGQRLLSSKPIVATPPRKKRKPRAQSHNENKRSSPLNQILKQRKRTRPGSFKSPPSKRKNIEKSSVRHEVQTEHNHQRFVSSNIIDVDECSQSSEDMVMSWFSNITESDNSVKEESTSKETVDDNVFQDSSSFRRSKLRIFKPITPISKKSLQILQESPILSPINQSPPSSSSGFTRNFSDSSPNDICAHLSERLKRRKRSEVLAKKSSPSEDTAEVEPSTFRCSKRLKLASS